MPAKASRTAKAATKATWESVEPGDIFLTTGAGLVGAVVRRGTSSPYGHIGIVHEPSILRRGGATYYMGPSWRTAEAFPAMPPWKPGLRMRWRHPSTVAAVLRVWRNETERQAILAKSTELVQARLPYAWSEILLIGMSTVLPHSWIPNIDLTRGVICSNHVAQAIHAARPDDYKKYIRFDPPGMWPGGLLFDLLNGMLWNDQRAQDEQLSRRMHLGGGWIATVGTAPCVCPSRSCYCYCDDTGGA